MTLLEILIAFSLLLFGVLAVAQVTPLLLEGQRLGEQHVAAAQYAQYFMELELKNSYTTESSLASAYNNGPMSSWPLVSAALPGVPANPVYRYNIFRSPVANGFSTSPYICVTVQVVWLDPMAQRYAAQQIYTLVAYKTPPPGQP
jgi:Tfp pilus assembly protein PilV